MSAFKATSGNLIVICYCPTWWRWLLYSHPDGMRRPDPADCKNECVAPRSRTGRSSRTRRQAVLDNLIEDASGVIQKVADEVAPGVVGAIDINGVVERVDIQRVVNRVDLQEVVERVDLNTVLERIDLDAVLARADLNQLISRIDLNAVLEQVDVDTIIDKVDINALLARADINAIVDKVDMEAIIDKLDINAIVARVDIDALVERTEIGSIIAATGAGIAGKAIDVARSQGVGLDFWVQRWTDRILRRRRSHRTGDPPIVVAQQETVSS